TERARGRGVNPEMDEDMQEFFRRFFGVPIPAPEQRGDPRRRAPAPDEEPQQRGVASGFIFTTDGYVMTNAHVVDGADEVYVTLTDKREFKARIIGADKRTDVAVVKIDAASLPSVRIGDVSRLRVGEWVMAIGSPFGLENTVTAGIVSAKARETGDYLPFIQTDVAINPGNSGGPLINMRGEVVGINSQIYSRSGGFMGISFAIPIDEATRVADQLRASGRVVRGRIGVQIGEVTKDVAEALGLGKANGALVRSVEAGGPAERAGVEPGDIITRFDGKAVERSTDLPRVVGSTKPGTKSTVQVFRRGNTRDLSVVVAELEPQTTRRANAAPEPKASSQAATIALGLTVTDLSEAIKRELKVKGGVKVESAEGSAARAGLREGDVVLAVANTEITDTRQFESVVSKLDKTKPVTVLFRRADWSQYVVIRPSSR
ncbi:MAG TPA: Do family serine endopeptidase, partial [Burkholderiaceae bacterium]|nr:Do family serine endopeptidase [Burkholderiaceae bacterium]